MPITVSANRRRLLSCVVARRGTTATSATNSSSSIPGSRRRGPSVSGSASSVLSSTAAATAAWDGQNGSPFSIRSWTRLASSSSRRESTRELYGRAMNRLAAAPAWPALGYRDHPPGAGGPAVADPPVSAISAPAGDYDVIVAGAGAGGGVAVCVLA